MVTGRRVLVAEGRGLVVVVLLDFVGFWIMGLRWGKMGSFSGAGAGVFTVVVLRGGDVCVVGLRVTVELETGLLDGFFVITGFLVLVSVGLRVLAAVVTAAGVEDVVRSLCTDWNVVNSS